MRTLTIGLAVLVVLTAVSGLQAATVSYQIAAGNDDGYTNGDNMGGNITAAYTFWPSYVAAPGNRATFLRWAIEVPDGATITSAYITIVQNNGVWEGEGLRTRSVQLDLVDSVNCAEFTDYEVTLIRRPVTGTTAIWDLTPPSGSTGIGTSYDSVDVSALVQEFIDMDGYAEGNYIGIRGTYSSGATASLFARTYEFTDATHAVGSQGAILTINYEVVPEPMTMGLLGLGFGGLLLRRRNRR